MKDTGRILGRGWLEDDSRLQFSKAANVDIEVHLAKQIIRNLRGGMQLLWKALVIEGRIIHEPR
jgi:hypothetical protein